MIKKAAIFISCLLLHFTLTTTVKAEEIVMTVSGNGSESTSQTQVQTQNTSTVSQENNANVTNNVSSDANTGDNNASLNSNGDTNINTGDANTTTEINNQNINTNAASTDCNGCNSSTAVNITGNGAGSTNVGSVSNSSSTTVTQTNTARITNNIYVKANTGYNTTSFNGGDTTIVTGNISAATIVNNKNINNSVYIGTGNLMQDTSIKIAGNGAGSFNFADVDNDSEIVITDINIAEILNNVEHDLNTGGNEALKNLGDVAIITGDIKSKITINNENINSNFVKVDCKCKENPPANPPSNPPANPPSGGVSVVQGASGSAGGPSGGPAKGEMLPVTGNNIPYTLVATLILFFLLLSGLYLRFHSAHAPPSK